MLLLLLVELGERLPSKLALSGNSELSFKEVKNGLAALLTIDDLFGAVVSLFKFVVWYRANLGIGKPSKIVSTKYDRAAGGQTFSDR